VLQAALGSGVGTPEESTGLQKPGTIVRPDPLQTAEKRAEGGSRTAPTEGFEERRASVRSMTLTLQAARKRFTPWRRRGRAFPRHSISILRRITW
jgi:hypothetical protein